MSKLIDTVSLWCQKADNDLKVANHEIDHDDPALDIICFHAQQASEKYLKAYLVYSLLFSDAHKTYFSKKSSNSN